MSPRPRLVEADASDSPPVDFEAEASLERCGALKDYWYVASLSSELQAGKPMARTVLGTPLVLFRDRAGAPAALFDRCLHRNARLSAGDVFDGKLGCPYHGWTYDRDGSCVEIPSLGPEQCGSVLGADGHAQAGLKLRPCDVGRVKTFPTLEQDGLVFVYLGGEPAQARRPAFRTPKWGEHGWTVYYMVSRFPNGVTNLVENFMDVPHTAFVHRGWFRRSSRRKVPAIVQRVDGSVLVTYEQGRDELSGLGRIFNPGGHPMEHTDKFYAPNVTRVDYAWGPSGFVITSQCTPISAFDTLVYTAISYRLPRDLPGALVSKALLPLVRWYTQQVIKQDVEIMQVQKEGLTQAAGAGAFQSSEADLLHADIEALRRWLREGAQGDGPKDEERKIAFWL